LTINIIVNVLIGGLLIGGIYGIVAIGLTLIFGILKIINFAHGEFLMLGMYISYFSCLYFGIDPYLSLLIVIPAIFFIGVICEAFLIKPIIEAPPDIQILLTFGLVLVIQNIALFLWTGDWRSLNIPLTFKTITIGDIHVQSTMFIAFLGSLLFIVLLFLFLKKSDYGKAIRACSDEREGALFVGLAIHKIYYITFGIGAMLAGIAGTLVLPFYAASPTVGLVFTMQAFIVITLGGLGSVPGALIGGLIVGIAESMGALFLTGSLKQVVTFVLFIAILCFRPSGVFGEKQRSV